MIFINCFSQIFVHALFSLYATDQNAAVRRLKNIRAFEAVAPHMYSELRRPEHICDKFETESPKKISFYWQQVGFDSVCSQLQSRLDVLAHFFKKKKIYQKSIEDKFKNFTMGNSNSSRNFKSLRKSFRRAGSTDQILSFKTNHPKISTGSLRSGQESSGNNRDNGSDYSRSHSLASNTTSSDVSSRVSWSDQDQLHVHSEYKISFKKVEKNLKRH